MLDANWTKIESEISVAAQQLYWQTKLNRGDRLPTRGAGDLPRTDMTAFVEAIEKWLERSRGKLWKLIAEEEAK